MKIKFKLKRYSLLMIIVAIATSGVSNFADSVFADETTRPTVIMEEYTVTGNIKSGGDFILEYTLRNTSQTSAVTNMTFMTSDSSGVFFPSAGTSNQHYIPYIEAGAAHTGEASLSINKRTADGTYNLNFSISYQSLDDNGIVLSSSGYITVTVSGNALSIVELSLSDHPIQGRPSYISVRYENSGDQELRNAKVIIEGNIDGAGQQILIGAIRSGASGVVEEYITFTAAGEQELVIYLTHENTDGENIMSEMLVTTASVMAGTENNQTDIEDPATDDGLSAHQSLVRIIMDNAVLIIIAVGVVCLIIIIISLIRRRR